MILSSQMYIWFLKKISYFEFIFHNQKFFYICSFPNYSCKNYSYIYFFVFVIISVLCKLSLYIFLDIYFEIKHYYIIILISLSKFLLVNYYYIIIF